MFWGSTLAIVIIAAVGACSRVLVLPCAGFCFLIWLCSGFLQWPCLFRGAVPQDSFEPKPLRGSAYQGLERQEGACAHWSCYSLFFWHQAALITSWMPHIRACLTWSWVARYNAVGFPHGFLPMPRTCEKSTIWIAIRASLHSPRLWLGIHQLSAPLLTALDALVRPSAGSGFPPRRSSLGRTTSIAARQIQLDRCVRRWRFGVIHIVSSTGGYLPASISFKPTPPRGSVQLQR